MLINDYWLLQHTDGDFTLVEPPTLQVSNLVKTYHQILLSLTRSQIADLSAIASQDFYQPGLEIYYQKISELLSPKFKPTDLSPKSRQQFFIAFEERQGNWISGLEILLGLDYTESQPEQVPKVQITSGNLEIDIVAELFLHLESGRIEWLVQNKSPQYLIKLVKQLSDRRNPEALEEMQRQKDLEAIQKVDLESQLKSSGFKF